MDEYREKADRMDRLLGREDGNGRVRRRLDQFGDLIGLVFVQFNEGSEDVNMLLDKMADCRVNKVAHMKGKQKAEQEKGVVVGQLRRNLSTVCVRAASQFLIYRMHQCGEGARLANKRRETNLNLERVMRVDRERQFVARIRGSF